ncbi:MAG: hypothetical protein KatS3mg027_2278 [Bacteroidia bacterium]|nr:MAG: hypothetical protein KatS3mg027_2278 [Bacteroidia bacterium]
MKRGLKILLVIFFAGAFLSFGQDKSKVIQKINGIDYFVHEVKKGESLYGISKLYGVDLQLILNENPILKEHGLKAGNKILIPVKSDSKTQEVFLDTLQFNYHKVLKGQTVYSICKQYGITQEWFYENNPSAASGIKEGEWVIVGKKNQLKKNIIPNVKDIKMEVEQKMEVIPKYVEKKREYTVLFLLPFGANKVDEIIVEDMVKYNQSFPMMSSMMIDFYKGFEYVRDSLKCDSFNVRLLPMDVNENDSLKLVQITKLQEYKMADLIVGPVYSSLIKTEMINAIERKLHIIPFISQNKFLFNHSEYSKTTPSVFVDVQALAQFVFDSLRYKGKVVLLMSNNNGEKEYAKEFKRYYNDLINKVNVKDTIRTFRSVADFKKVVKEKEQYVVVLLTNNQVVATDYITQLSIICKTSPITLCGLYKTLYFDNLDLEYLNQMQFTFAYYQNTTSIDSYASYLRKYKEEFNSDPSLFFYEGIEIAQYYFKLINSYGLNALYELNNYRKEDKSAFMKFQFYRPDENTGFQNNGEFLFRIQDRKIQVIK